MAYDLLTVKEVAEELDMRDKCSAEMVRRYIREGKLTAYRIGRRLKVKRRELDRFLESRKVK